MGYFIKNEMNNAGTKWSETWDSNPQPRAPKARALANCASLRYFCQNEWWAYMDLNHGPRHYQCRALTS